MYVPGQNKTIISRHTICLTVSDYDYILKEIGRQEESEFEINVEVYSDDEEN